jgi:hypothetical protein
MARRAEEIALNRPSPPLAARRPARFIVTGNRKFESHAVVLAALKRNPPMICVALPTIAAMLAWTSTAREMPGAAL